jgi:DNA (cytosine-5)-methyltransferase 1
MRPRLLDLFCGAGGAAMGYHRAGFEVVGVDINPQPHYPFEFYQADALDVLFDFARGELDSDIHRGELITAIHASPPCQLYSTVGKQAAKKHGITYPDLVEPTRTLLQKTGLPYVIENVMGAPLVSPILLCGSSFGLDIRRHRRFELGGFDILLTPPCAHHWQKPRFRSMDKRRNGALQTVVGVHGHIKYKGERGLREAAMGIDWMTPDELTEAIPPAYTEWIGRHLLQAIGTVAA